MVVIGRDGEGEDGDGGGEPTGLLGHYRARDGSHGARVELDLDRPHVGLVVGKRGSGKSYTLGVLAEAIARADRVAPVVVDPMGAFRTLDRPPVSARVAEPRVAADALSHRGRGVDWWDQIRRAGPDRSSGRPRLNETPWQGCRSTSTTPTQRPRRAARRRTTPDGRPVAGLRRRRARATGSDRPSHGSGLRRTRP